MKRTEQQKRNQEFIEFARNYGVKDDRRPCWDGKSFVVLCEFVNTINDQGLYYKIYDMDKVSKELAKCNWSMPSYVVRFRDKEKAVGLAKVLDDLQNCRSARMNIKRVFNTYLAKLEEI